MDSSAVEICLFGSESKDSRKTQRHVVNHSIDEVTRILSKEKSHLHAAYSSTTL